MFFRAEACQFLEAFLNRKRLLHLHDALHCLQGTVEASQILEAFLNRKRIYKMFFRIEASQILEAFLEAFLKVRDFKKCS